MRILEVNLPEREGQTARTIAVAFAHPWKRMSFRDLGEQYVKVTTCAIGQKMDKVTEDGKPCYKFYAFNQVKWPLIARTVDGKPQRGQTFCTLPKERLSRKNGARAALAATLKHLKSAFNYSERTLIWREFHRVMRTGVVPDEDGNGGVPAQLALVAVPSTVSEAPASGGVLMLASPTLWLAQSKYVH